MANTITKQVLADGERNLIVKVHIVSDGSEETNLPLIVVTDYNDYNVGVRPWTEVKIDKVTFSGLAAAASLTFLWEGTPNVKAFTVNMSNTSPVDWCKTGGLVNDALAATGNILLTTTALASGDELTFTLYLKKKS
jgi:hypothetical protein